MGRCKQADHCGNPAWCKTTGKCLKAEPEPVVCPHSTSPTALQTGHYFKLERGQWTKDGNWPPTFYQASGRTYIGCLTLEQRIELDALIDGYLKGRGA